LTTAPTKKQHQYNIPKAQMQTLTQRKNKNLFKRGKTPRNTNYKAASAEAIYSLKQSWPYSTANTSQKDNIRIPKLLIEDNGIRSIQRINGPHHDTIGNLLEDMAETRRPSQQADDVPNCDAW